MLNSKKRLSKAIFSTRPLRRVPFKYGTIVFYGGEPGAAVAVSKKVARTAVVRNRMRRRVYHALKTVQFTQATVIHPTRESLTAPYSDIVDSLVSALTVR